MKWRRLVTGLLPGLCLWRWHLHVMGLLESAICRKYVQDICLALARHRTDLQLCSAIADGYNEDLSQNGSGSSITVRAIWRAVIRSWVHSGSSSGLDAWSNCKLAIHPSTPLASPHFNTLCLITADSGKLVCRTEEGRSQGVVKAL
jgi:hypothetical protein